MVELLSESGRAGYQAILERLANDPEEADRKTEGFNAGGKTKITYRRLMSRHNVITLSRASANDRIVLQGECRSSSIGGHYLWPMHTFLLVRTK